MGISPFRGRFGLRDLPSSRSAASGSSDVSACHGLSARPGIGPFHSRALAEPA